MILTREQKNHLERFCQGIQNFLLPFDKQRTQTKDGYWWCEDWHYIEVLKYLFNEDRLYGLDRPPYRLRNNPLFNKEQMIKEGKERMEMLDSLEIVKDLADAIYICEVGRGMDIAVTKIIKQWKQIFCYDINSYHKSFAVQFFNQYYGDSINYTLASTNDIDFSTIVIRVILIANDVQFIEEKQKQILNNPNIVAAIINGKNIK